MRWTLVSLLLQCLLHGGITAVPQLGGKAYHRGFTDLRRLPQLAGGHERRLIVVFGYVVGYPLMSLGHRRVTALYF